MGDKPFHIKFDKINGFIRVYDGGKQLVLFGAEKYDSIYNRIRYVIAVKGDVTYAFFSHNYTKLKIDSYDYLSLEKTLTICNVIILIDSVFNKD